MSAQVQGTRELTAEDKEKIHVLRLACSLNLPFDVMVGITIEELFSKCFNNNCGESKLPEKEKNIIDRDVAKYRKSGGLPAYVTRFSSLQEHQISRR